jgi:16S rRNA (guanine527-N7)-methyltransferase
VTDDLSAFPQLERYRELIMMYHRSLDLMSARAVVNLDAKLRESLRYAEMIRQHDLLRAPVPRVTEEKVNAKKEMTSSPSLLDLGSGVGLPGIPIAIACPDITVFLVERRRKRATFLQIVLSKLHLANAVLVAEDVRNFQGETVRCITAQAVGHFLDSYCMTQHLHSEQVTLLSRKGNAYRSEVATLQEVLALATGVIEPPIIHETPLDEQATLVALTLTGGIPCPS